MNENEQVYQLFGRFRSEDFYRCLITAGSHSSSFFVINSVARCIPETDVHLFCDGTFKTRPQGTAQVLVLFATVAGKVILF